MNLDPRNSQNYKQSLEKSKAMNTGARFQVGEERLTANEIAERAFCSKQTVNKWVSERGENPEKFIKRMKKRVICDCEPFQSCEQCSH